MIQTQQLKAGWGIKRLSEVAEFVNGKAFKPSDWKEKGWPIIRIQNLTDHTKEFNYYEGDVEDRYFVNKGDILISWSASLGVFIWNRDKAVLNQHIFKVEVNDKIVDKNYFFYVIQTKIEEMILRVHGSTMKHITKGQFEKIEIPVPPMEVQKHIIAVLERADKLKQRREQTNKEIKEVVASIFAEMFGDPTKNGKNFPVKTLDEISIKINDGTHFTPKYMASGVPFLRVTDITNSNESKKFISEEEHKELIKRCKPEKGDILYTKNGTIGIAKTIDWDYEFSIFVSLCLIKPKKEEILSKYLEVFLNTPFALSQALQHSKKGTITNLHLIEIKKMLVPVPPIKKQQEFLRIIEKIESIKNYQLNVTREINGLFDALMQKAFNGEIK